MDQDNVIQLLDSTNVLRNIVIDIEKELKIEHNKGLKKNVISPAHSKSHKKYPNQMVK